MMKLRFVGWEEGFNKVSFTKLLAEQGNLGLKEAKGITDSILGGKEIAISVEDDQAEKLALKAKELGVRCEILP